METEGQRKARELRNRQRRAEEAQAEVERVAAELEFEAEITALCATHPAM